MPNRILRDGFVDSEAINALSDWTHRVYSNLLVKCDDAGRFDGRLEFIRSHLFPLGTTRRTEDFRKSVEELEGGGLVIRYAHEGKPFLQVTKWQKCGKSITSRYPWSDGNHEIEYVERQTRDGPKDFVVSSISDGVRTPSVPHKDGVTRKTNTETETETKTKRSASADRAPPRTLNAQQRLGERYKNLWMGLYSEAGCCVLNKEHYAMLARIVSSIGEERAEKAIDRFIKDRSEFVVTARHALEIFVKRVNQYNAGAAPPVGGSNGVRTANRPLARAQVYDQEADQ